MSCYAIEPKTKEYRWDSKDCRIPMSAHCGHPNKVCWGPGFNVGLKKPFGISLGLCEKCAKLATCDSILTDERWRGMKMILVEHGIEIPRREDVTMVLVEAQRIPTRGRSYEDIANSYTYALAA